MLVSYLFSPFNLVFMMISLKVMHTIPPPHDPHAHTLPYYLPTIPLQPRRRALGMLTAVLGSATAAVERCTSIEEELYSSQVSTPLVPFTVVYGDTRGSVTTPPAT